MTVVRRDRGERYVPPGHDETVTARKLVGPDTGCTKIDAHVTTFRPGASMAEESHAESDHVLFVLAGNVVVEQSGEEIAELGAGDAIHIPAGESHRVINRGAVDGVFFAATVPPVSP